MDAYLAVASKRDQRAYAGRPVPEDAVRRILDAGRIRKLQEQPALAVPRAGGPRAGRPGCADRIRAPNLLDAPLVIAIVVGGRGPVAFDAGRAAQNMMLAAWNEGVVSCPNGVANRERMTELLGLEADLQVQIVL